MYIEPPSSGKDVLSSEPEELIGFSDSSSQVLHPARHEYNHPSSLALNSVHPVQDLNRFRETEPKRVEVSVELSNRYIKLRDDILQSKRELTALRREFVAKQDQQTLLVAECKEDDVNRAHLESLIVCLTQVASLVHDEEKLSLSVSQKVESLKRALAPILQWNTHLASLMHCLESQQKDVIRSARPISSRTQAVSPVNTWIP